MFFKMAMGDHLEIRGQDDLKIKKKAIRFATTKIVELDILCIRIACLVPELLKWRLVDILLC